MAIAASAAPFSPSSSSTGPSHSVAPVALPAGTAEAAEAAAPMRRMGSGSAGRRVFAGKLRSGGASWVALDLDTDSEDDCTAPPRPPTNGGVGGGSRTSAAAALGAAVLRPSKVKREASSDAAALGAAVLRPSKVKREASWTSASCVVAGSGGVSSGAVPAPGSAWGGAALKREARGEVKREIKAEVKREVKREVKGEVKAEVKGEVKSEAKREAALSSRVKTELLSPEAIASSREAVTALLRRAFAAARASAEEAASWAASLEAAAFSAFEAQRRAAAEAAVAAGEASEPSALVAAGPSALRRYRAEARRLAGALRVPDVGSSLVGDLRGVKLSAGQLLTLPQEQLLPAAKRARLLELRTAGAQAVADPSRELSFKDEDMACEECGQAGAVTWEYMVSVRGGFTKAETWGSSEGAERAERCRAACGRCLAEWFFDQ